MSFGNEMVHGGEEEAKGSMEDFTTQVGVIPILRIKREQKCIRCGLVRFQRPQQEWAFSSIQRYIYIYI